MNEQKNKWNFFPISSVRWNMWLIFLFYVLFFVSHSSRGFSRVIHQIWIRMCHQNPIVGFEHLRCIQLLASFSSLESFSIRFIFRVAFFPQFVFESRINDASHIRTRIHIDEAGILGYIHNIRTKTWYKWIFR